MSLEDMYVPVALIYTHSMSGEAGALLLGAKPLHWSQQ